MEEPFSFETRLHRFIGKRNTSVEIKRIPTIWFTVGIIHPLLSKIIDLVCIRLVIAGGFSLSAMTYPIQCVDQLSL